MRKSILFFLLGLSGIANAQWGQNSVRFYWSKQGSAAQTDSIRFIQGSGATLTQSGNTLTISSAPGAGSVDSLNIVNLSVAATDIVNSAILNAKYANGSLTVNKFATSVYPAIRRNVGWTSNGTITSDTVTTRIEWGGTPNTTHKIFDADNDTISFVPQTLNVISVKDDATTLAAIDSTGKIITAVGVDVPASGAMTIGSSSLTALTVTTDGTGTGEVILPNNSIGSAELATDAAAVQARNFTGWTAQGGLIAKDTVVARIEWGGTPNASIKAFDADNDSILTIPQTLYPIDYKDGATRIFAVDSTGFVMKSDLLEFLGGALQATPTTGASDTTANYMPMKAFSVGDTATFDIFLSKRFASLDSIVVYAYSNTATSAVVFNCGVRQTAVGDAIAGAFNTAATKTISTGTAGTLRQWSLTSFGSLTASTPSMLRGKIYRTAGGTGGDIFVNRVLIYGVGLR